MLRDSYESDSDDETDESSSDDTPGGSSTDESPADWVHEREIIDEGNGVGHVWYRVQQDDEADLEAIVGVFDDVIADVIDRFSLRAHDVMSLALFSTGQADALVTSTGLLPVGDMDADAVMDVVEQAAQSGNPIGERTFRLARIVVRFVRSPVLGGCAAAGGGAEAARAPPAPTPEWYKAHPQIVARIANEDMMCCARALVYLEARREYLGGPRTPAATSRKRALTNFKRKKQAAAAEALCAHAGVDPAQPVGATQLQSFANFLQCRIHVVDWVGRRVAWTTETPPTLADTDGGELPHHYLLQTSAHFEPIINMGAFAGFNGWCTTCQKGYSAQRAHRCAGKCSCCMTKGCPGMAALARSRAGLAVDAAPPLQKIEWLECKECSRCFPRSEGGGSECFDRHITDGVCARLWKCRKRRCGRVFRRDQVSPETHVCSHVWCQSCKAFKSLKHAREECFVKREPLKAPSERYLFIDMECTQSGRDEAGCTGVHRANLIVSMDWAGVETIHHDESEFVQWLLRTKQGHTVVAHNGGGYDYALLYRYLCTHTTQCMLPIYRGTRLMAVHIGRGKNAIRLVDSLNWIPTSLQNFPKMLGLQTSVAKGFFPHWFSTPATQAYEGVVPGREHFHEDDMDEGTRAAFRQWHAAETRRTDPTSGGYTGAWNLRRELLRYCRNDVLILREGCMRFRRMFLECSRGECDPFQYTTIASTCMALYVAQHMPEDTIANMPSFVGRLLRRALFGGRVNARQLYFDASERPAVRGHYCDVASMYPYVQAVRAYPVGHPTLHGDWNRSVGSTRQHYKRMKASRKAGWELMEPIEAYLGEGTLAIVECDVECPDNLFHAVLPHRCAESGKLLFDLRPKQHQWYTSVELRKALALGYRVVRVHRAAVWERTTTTLFRSYIRTFLRMKMEASGWPAECTTEAAKREYLGACRRHEGLDVELRAECVAPNACVYAVAKLCLNSLWGKWCEKEENRAQTRLFHHGQRDALLRCVFNPAHARCELILVHANVAEQRFVYEVTFRFRAAADGDPSAGVAAAAATRAQPRRSNVALGVFTTAYGRLHLYEQLERLGDQVLYMDTDSIMYAHDAGTAAPPHAHIPRGRFIGEWTDELAAADGPPRTIVQLVAAGPKNYAMRLDRPDAHNRSEFVKVKGFNLRRMRAREAITLPIMRDMVTTQAGRRKRRIRVERESIVRNKQRKVVHNACEARTYRFVYDKCWLDEERLTTLPWGHRGVPPGARAPPMS